MTGILLALLAALGWGASGVFARLGLAGMRGQLGTLVSMAGSLMLALAAAVLFDRPGLDRFPWVAIGYFALLGMLSFPGGRLMNFLAVSRLGAARGTAITSAYPLVTLVLAVILMGEPVNPSVVAGTLMVVGGLALVVTDR